MDRAALLTLERRLTETNRLSPGDARALFGEVWRLRLENESLRCESDAAKHRADRWKAAVRLHHDQRGSDRCHLDDLKLYHDVLGVNPDPYVTALPPEDVMLEDCERYVRQRQDPSVAGSYPMPAGCATLAQLTAEVERPRREAAQRKGAG